MSTKSPKILKGIRAAFLGFRWLFVLCLVGTLVQLFRVPEAITATVTLAPSAAVDLLHRANLVVRVDAQKADLELPVGAAADPDLKALARTATLPGMTAAALAGLLLCEIIQRLLRNLEAGELFSDRNVKLLRRLTAVLIAATVLVRVLTGWGNLIFAKYAAAHLTVAGAPMVRSVDHVGIAGLRLDLGSADIVVVLLLLLILWAFMEGAELKRDSELTV